MDRLGSFSADGRGVRWWVCADRSLVPGRSAFKSAHSGAGRRIGVAVRFAVEFRRERFIRGREPPFSPRWDAVSCLDSSIVAVSFSAAERRIELLDGTLEVDTVSDTKRPLVVLVGDTEIRATGTRFIVSTRPLPSKKGTGQ